MAYVEAAAKSIAPVLREGTGDSGISIAGRHNGANGWLAVGCPDLTTPARRASGREYHLLSGRVLPGRVIIGTR